MFQWNYGIKFILDLFNEELKSFANIPVFLRGLVYVTFANIPQKNARTGKLDMRMLFHIYSINILENVYTKHQNNRTKKVTSRAL